MSHIDILKEILTTFELQIYLAQPVLNMNSRILETKVKNLGSSGYLITTL